MPRDYDRCTSCGERKPGEVEERFSFGVYAGWFCIQCCYKYSDHCGIDQRQGTAEEYEAMGETYYEDSY